MIISGTVLCAFRRRAGSLVSLLVLSAIAIADDSTGPTELNDQDARELVNEIDEVVEESELALRSLLSTHLSLDAALDTNDYDAAEIIAWVRSETYWVPYSGVLKGATGVLMDRRGNSLDRSLLLAELLERAGYEVRLARKQLNNAETRSVVDAVSREQRMQPNGGALQQMPEPIRSYQQEVRAQARDLAALIDVDQQVPGVGTSAEHAAGTKDHWWVQYRGDSVWQDVDLARIVDGTPEALEAESFYLTDELPSELYHRVIVRVVIERWQDGETVEELPLTHEFLVAEQPLFTQFEISIDPFATEWLGWNDSMPDITVLDIADDAGFWRPSLTVGNQVIRGRWFNDAGTFEIPPVVAIALKMQEATGALDRMTADPEDTERPSSHLTAAWLEYETLDPTGSTQTVRRELFNLLGARRYGNGATNRLRLSDSDRRERGLALQTQVSNMLATTMPHADALDRSYLDTLVGLRETLIALTYLAVDSEDPRVPQTLFNAMNAFPNYDLMRIAAIRGAWSSARQHVYIDRPNVIASHLVNAVDGGEPRIEFHNDIVLNHVGILPGTKRSQKLLRLEQGVLDTLAESAITGDKNSLNTFRHFSRRTEGGKTWRIVMPDSLDKNTLELFPEDSRKHIESALSTGHAIAASPDVYSWGDRHFASWWQIDLADGSSLGHGYRGWGTETTETGGLNTIPGAGARKGAQDVGRKFHCLKMNAIVAEKWATDPTVIIDTTSDAFQMTLYGDAGRSLMNKIKRRARAVIQRVLTALRLRRPYC